MKDKRTKERVQHSLNAVLSGLHTTSRQRDRFFETATGGYKTNRKVSVAFVLAAALLLITVTALAVALLSPREVVEQVAVPMAQQNDKEWRVETDFTPEELAEFIRACNENGIDLDENHAIMEAIRSGKGYDEEEAIMAVCRVAFGGSYGEWKPSEQRWFQEMMVAIGWAKEVTVEAPGPDDLPEEEARVRMLAALYEKYGKDLPIEDRTQMAVSMTYFASDTEDGIAWTLYCQPRGHGFGTHYSVSMDRSGQVIRADRWEETQPVEAEPEPVFTLTEAEAIHLAAEAIRTEYRVNTPLDDPAFYRWFVNPSGRGDAVWRINFISLTIHGGFCSARVNDATHEVTIESADVSDITADNILARYCTVHGWYNEWDTAVWAEIAEKAAGLPANTMEGRVVKGTPWIAWREGLLTRDEAEEKAFRQAGIRLGDVNSACLIDAAPNPVWKFRLLPWDESYQDSIVAEIDAVTGKMTDLDLYKSDYTDLEPSFHMITLHRIWARLELEENGPLYLARLAVLKRFADMSFDQPEIDSLPIFDESYWLPIIDGSTVRFRSQWSNVPDYQVELDETGIAAEVVELESSGTEALPQDRLPGSDGNG